MTTTLVLRLGGPVQTWAGYRLIANKNPVPTAPLPRKSAVAGLVGAAIGSRDLADLTGAFTLHVRVDHATAPTVDIQTLNPLPHTVRPHVDRAEALRTLGKGPRLNHERRGGGNFPTVLMNRTLLPYSEFIVALTTDDDTAEQWHHAFRAPVFMPYLGRKANAPTFPFLLGHTTLSPADLLTSLPRLALPPQDAPARAYRVDGDYHNHDAAPLHLPTPPDTATRKDQLAWCSTQLSH